MIPQRIDTKLIIKVKLTNGQETYIGPPCFSFFRWPCADDQACTGKYVRVQLNQDVVGESSSVVNCNVKQETDSHLYIVPSHKVFEQSEIIEAPKKQIKCDEICFDIVNFINIPIQMVESYQLVNVPSKSIDDLSDQDIDASNQKTLESVSIDLLALKFIYEKISAYQRNKVGDRKDLINEWLNIKQRILNQERSSKQKTLTNIIPADGGPDKTMHSIKFASSGPRKKESISVPDTKKDAQLNIKKLDKSKLKSKGLGDTVKKMTDKLGIPQCQGCKDRQNWLNKFFPYKKK